MKALLLTCLLGLTLTSSSKAEDTCSTYATCEDCTAQSGCIWAVLTKDYSLACVSAETTEHIRQISATADKCTNQTTYNFVPGIPSLKDNSYTNWGDLKTKAISNVKNENVQSYNGEGHYFLFGSSNPSDSSYGEKMTEYLVQLTPKKLTIPESVTHLSFYFSSPYFSSRSKGGLNILLDNTVIMRLDSTNIFNFENKYELIDVNIKKYADNETHDLKFHYFTNYLPQQKLVPTVLVDYVHLMSCNDTTYINTEGTVPKDSYPPRCSQWCASGKEIDGECNEECNNAECSFDFGMCDQDIDYNQLFAQEDPDDKKVKNNNKDNSKAKKDTGLALMIVAIVILVVFLVVFFIVVYRTRERIITKKGKESNAQSVGDDERDKIGAEGNSELWAIDKKYLTFDLGGREADIGKEYSEDVTISNKRLDFKECSFKVILPEDKKYLMTTNASKFKLGKGEIITIRISVTLFCTASLSNEVYIVSLDDNGKPFQHYIALAAITGKASNRINPDEVIVKEQIGEGSFGIVSKGEWRGKTVAIKTLKTVNETSREEFDRETAVLEKLDCPFIVKFYGSYITNSELWMVSEYISGGGLDSAMKKYILSPRMRIRISYDIARGMKYLHDMRIIHRDLKPENILCSNLSFFADAIVKLTDFGTSKFFEGESAQVMTKGIGTPVYMAPEVMSGKANYTLAADVYSYGVTFVHVWNEVEPFSDLNMPYIKFIKFIMDGNKPTLNPGCSQAGIDLVDKCLSNDPKSRPGFDYIVNVLGGLVQEFSSYIPNEQDVVPKQQN